MAAAVATPQLLGPVDTGSSFMLASIQNNQPYILNGISYNNETIYYWESNLSLLLTWSKLAIFTAKLSVSTDQQLHSVSQPQNPLVFSGLTGNNFNITMMDTINGGNVEFRSDGVTIGNGSTASNIIFQQDMYSNWQPPDVFLSTVSYSILNTSGETAGILTTPIGTTIPANNIIILPVLWYYNCTTTGSYDVINYPLDTISNWFCLVNPTISECSQIDIVPSGWTNLDDCIIGNNYSYCSIGKFCGDSSCKGPCSVIYEDCNYKSGIYICEFNSDKYYNDTTWWTSPIFIGIIIALVILIILLVIISIPVSQNGEKVEPQVSTDYNNYYVST